MVIRANPNAGRAPVGRRSGAGRAPVGRLTVAAIFCRVLYYFIHENDAIKMCNRVRNIVRLLIRGPTQLNATQTQLWRKNVAIYFSIYFRNLSSCGENIEIFFRPLFIDPISSY